MMKVCAQCGIEKPLSRFRKHCRGQHGVAARCRGCAAERARSVTRISRKSTGGDVSLREAELKETARRFVGRGHADARTVHAGYARSIHMLYLELERGGAKQAAMDDAPIARFYKARRNGRKRGARRSVE